MGEKRVQRRFDVALRVRIVRPRPALDEAPALPIRRKDQEPLFRERLDVPAVGILEPPARVHVENGRKGTVARGNGDLDRHLDLAGAKRFLPRLDLRQAGARHSGQQYGEQSIHSHGSPPIPPVGVAWQNARLPTMFFVEVTTSQGKP